MKVFIVDSSAAYRDMFLNAGFEVVDNFLKADLVQFTGGADVSPFLYGHPQHFTTFNDQRRDLVEAGYFAFAQRMGKRMAGICRGGQFLNVMNGGTMYQDIKGHAIGGTHPCYDRFTNQRHQVTSTHHQMMNPHPSGEVITLGSPAHHVIDFNGEEFVDIGDVDATEVVYYDKTKALCFQPHPEFYGADSTRDYYFELLNRYLDVKV